MMKNKILIAIIICILSFSLAYAQEGTINVEYIFEQSGQSTQNIILPTEVDLEVNAVDLADKETTGTISSWQASDVSGQYIDSNNVTQTATYTAAFAGWKLESVNGSSVDGNYIYPDDDVVYFDDAPFNSFGDITSLKFKALWGKTIYVRDKYNFNDITNVYGYNVAGTNGDILTAKIAWDTSTTYSSNYNSGATKDSPVSTIQKAYELLRNTNGGKICIVNHVTLEGAQSAQSYDSGFTNKAVTEYIDFGDNLNIAGVVTWSGKNLGSGTSVENKASAGADFKNGYLYIKNTRGAGVYKGKTYTSHAIRLRFHTNTVLEDLNALNHRENYNSIKARETNDGYMYGKANKRLVLESTFVGYKRSTNQTKSGLDTTNWGHSTVTINSISCGALTKGMGGSMHIVGSNATYTENGTNHTISASDNVYVNIRTYAVYHLYAFYNSGTKSVGNIHINLENTSVSIMYGIYSGTANCSVYTIRTNDLKASTLTPNTASANIGSLKVALRGTGSTSQKITDYYGGGYNTSSAGALSKLSANSNILIAGQTITNFYGGGNQVATLYQGDINITVKSGTITNLFGGGLGGYVGTEQNKGNITLNIEGGKITNLFGGGSRRLCTAICIQ